MSRKPDNSFRLAHLSDFHLHADPQVQELGVNSFESFNAVASELAQQRDIDGLIITGDISQDGSDASYQHTAQLNELGYPIMALPGNHDVVSKVAQLQAHERIVQLNDYWQIVMLDSVLSGRPSGFLNSNELLLIREALMKNPNKHLLVALHHHPVPVGSRWLDTHILQNGEVLARVLDSVEQIKGVLCGHVHQEADIQIADKPIYTVPSTWVQFKPHSEDFALDDCQPGFRLLDLKDDGSIETSVKRISHKTFTADMQSKGY